MGWAKVSIKFVDEWESQTDVHFIHSKDGASQNVRMKEVLTKKRPKRQNVKLGSQESQTLNITSPNEKIDSLMSWQQQSLHEMNFLDMSFLISRN